MKIKNIFKKHLQHFYLISALPECSFPVHFRLCASGLEVGGHLESPTGRGLLEGDLELARCCLDPEEDG